MRLREAWPPMPCHRANNMLSPHCHCPCSHPCCWALPWLRRDAAQKQSPVLPGEPVVRVSHLQHCLQQCFAILMHDLSHRGDLSTTRQQLRLQHRGQARSVPAQAPHCSTHVQPQPQSCLPSSPRGLHNAIILTKKPQDALTVGASGNLSERTPASKNHSG